MERGLVRAGVYMWCFAGAIWAAKRCPQASEKKRFFPVFWV
jgi:hypothetical protein